MKKVILLLFACTIYINVFAQAKYVFYFIGDGMGFGAVSYAEMVLAAQQGVHGSKDLVFSTFPYTGFATTYSANNTVTCSAAAGTALATGNKTNNGRIAMNPNATKSFKSIASTFKDKGYRVGITTSVSIDHATPAVFYAHQPSRKMYYEIAMDLPASQFDFFAGAGFLNPSPDDKPCLWDSLEGSGYKICRSIEEAKKSKAKKNILIQPEDKFADALVYSIDKKADDYTLAQITETAIQKLNNPKGFFLMVEGGQIDWASHDNDAAAMVGEMMEFSDAIKVALEFYKKHPKETLIVVTADHETGGLGIVDNSPISLLQLKTPQGGVIDHHLFDDRYEWKQLSYRQFAALMQQDYICDTLSAKDERKLRKLYAAYTTGTCPNDSASCAIKDVTAFRNDLARLLSERRGAGYLTHSHTGTMVPVYAIGVNASTFCGKMNNTDIPQRILKAANIK